MLALVTGAAGVGNALGSVIGNRRRARTPSARPRCSPLVAVAAALLTALLYSLGPSDPLGLVTGLFGQLAKLSLDALIQRDIADHVRARVFSWSETILQGFWVTGGAIGLPIPLQPVLGFAIVTAVVVASVLVALRSRRVGPPRRVAPTRPGGRTRRG